MSKTPRISIPKAVKTYVLERDNYQCQSCGKKNSKSRLNIDQIIPLPSGSNDISNLQVLCSQCNQKKKHHFDSRFHRHYS